MGLLLPQLPDGQLFDMGKVDYLCSRSFVDVSTVIAKFETWLPRPRHREEGDVAIDPAYFPEVRRRISQWAGDHAVVEVIDDGVISSSFRITGSRFPDDWPRLDAEGRR